ncbi:MAG: AraC family transcriptional regulator [Prevotella sp.]
MKLCLRNTNDSIRQIAATFHFPDDSLMIRYFKAHTGLTPVQYRRLTHSH